MLDGNQSRPTTRREHMRWCTNGGRIYVGQWRYLMSILRLSREASVWPKTDFLLPAGHIVSVPGMKWLADLRCNL